MRGSIELLLARMPDSDLRKAELRARASRLATECGCRAGGVAFLVALVAAAVHVLGKPELDLGSLLLALPFALVASFIGKLAGIGTARSQLFVLRRSLLSASRSSEVNHVHVHQVGDPVRDHV